MLKEKISDIRRLALVECNPLTPEEWYKQVNDKPDIYCNAGFFDYGAGGNRIPVNSLKINNYVYGDKYMNDGLGILNNMPKICNIKKDECTDFVSGMPIIANNGVDVASKWVTTLKDIAGLNLRTIFGFNDTHVFFESIPLTMAEMYNFSVKNNMTNAINLDGGGSSMIGLGDVIYKESGYKRGVHNLLALWLKKEENDMEWKEPNWAGLIWPWIQVDKNGIVRSQNSNYDTALASAKRENWSLWDRVARTRVYPSVQVTAPSNPAPIEQSETAFLNELEEKIKGRKKWLQEK